MEKRLRLSNCQTYISGQEDWYQSLSCGCVLNLWQTSSYIADLSVIFLVFFFPSRYFMRMIILIRFLESLSNTIHDIENKISIDIIPDKSVESNLDIYLSYLSTKFEVKVIIVITDITDTERKKDQPVQISLDSSSRQTRRTRRV